MIINIETSPKYNVFIQDGCINDGTIKELFHKYKGKKVAIISDNNVAKLYLDKVHKSLEDVGIENTAFVFGAGEWNKTLKTAEEIYHFLCNSKITRSDIIITLGGGVVGDVAGFVAATFLRGIKYVQIPTTLLAMIDSSVGGKTAVNLKEGKNLIGCFYQPDKVIIDTDCLESLSHEEWQNGIGEMIKYGAIQDNELFEKLEQLDITEHITELIIRCINIKKGIVEQDTLDIGKRQILNFGHTLGHCIEKHSNYNISHGKAVGIGMVLITKWSEERCLTKSGTALRIKRLLNKYNMPTEYHLELASLWAQADTDKKRKGNTITLAIIEEVGKSRLLGINADRFLNESIDITAKSSFLSGMITCPPSKSIAHRAILAAMLSEKECIINNIELSQDINATIGAIKAVGKKVSYKNGNLVISGNIINDNITIDCNESGTTFRFLLAILPALGIKATLTGKKRLGQRPYGSLADELEKKGVTIDTKKGLPVNLSGQLKGGDFYLAGNISSQFISGLLFALPILPQNSRIILTSPLESSSYIDLTINCLAEFGVEVDKLKNGYYVKGNQHYSNAEYRVEGDFSSASFWACGAALNGKLDIIGLDKSSLQGDKEIINILKHMGASIKELPDGYRVEATTLRGIELDAKDIPDLAPIISIVMAYAEGESRIKNTERLRLKECDRQQAIIKMLSQMGVQVTIRGNDIIINGRQKINGGVFDTYNDHRIAMSLAIAALKSDNIVIKDAQVVKKSYPNFYIDYNNVGGQYVINMGK